MKSNGLGVGACTSISRNDIDTVSYSGWRYGTGLLQIISSSHLLFGITDLTNIYQAPTLCDATVRKKGKKRINSVSKGGKPM